MRTIVRSASGGNHECSISVEFDRRQSRYGTPEELVEELALTDLAHIRTVTLASTTRSLSTPRSRRLAT